MERVSDERLDDTITEIEADRAMGDPGHDMDDYALDLRDCRAELAETKRKLAEAKQENRDRADCERSLTEWNETLSNRLDEAVALIADLNAFANMSEPLAERCEAFVAAQGGSDDKV